jgi:valyl-tRNA synthetase
MVKPAYQQPVDAASLKATIGFFERILKLLHPFMPFITEEIWHDDLFGEKGELDCIIVASYPLSGAADASILKEVEVVKGVVAGIRNIRNTKQLSPKAPLPLSIKSNAGLDYEKWLNIVNKLANVDDVVFVEDKVAGAATFMVGSDEFFIKLEENIDVEAERERLNAELTYLQGFLKSVDAKLNNERFVQNAKPEIIENERNKKADAEVKIGIILQSLGSIA